MRLLKNVSGRFVWTTVVIGVLFSSVHADVYLHMPRGSNNRLNENSANRNNANRVFDSQNNNRGGYNVGVIEQNDNGNNEQQQYNMKYFQSSATGPSFFTVEWTNQHGCGGNEDTDPHQQNCELVIQYLCQPVDDSIAARDRIRNGAQTTTNRYQRPNNLDETQAQFNTRKNGNVDPNLVLQEPFEWYDKCLVKERNEGLFTADQVLNDNNGLGYSGAIYTRQNPNGNRNGYECPEERDYYPYFHPSPWKDIVIMTDNVTNCDYYQSESFNVQPKHECVENWPNNNNERRHYSRYNNEADCQANGGTWTALYNFLEKDPSKATQQACEGSSTDQVTYIWHIPYDSVDGETPECLVALSQPDCQQAAWSRTNHLGNGRGTEALNYTWQIPFFPSGDEQRCVLRLRYNISTDDYDPFTTDASYNEDIAAGVESPIEQNPLVEVGASTPLRLAINTAQTGRTFQDRSHVFVLRPRPAGVDNERIFNLNVRGKRGNIVQTYPAVEYDFFPSLLNMAPDDLVHIQWTGSNTHNNGQPEGDGQAGDAGEGRGGTDRANMVQIPSLNDNFPLAYESSNMFQSATVRWIYNQELEGAGAEAVAIAFASSGFYRCRTGCSAPAQGGQNLNNQLDNAPPSFEGALLQFEEGTYHYMCTRNNNFSNRSQKGSLVVR